MGKKAKLKQLKKNGVTYDLFHYREEDYLEVFKENVRQFIKMS